MFCGSGSVDILRNTIVYYLISCTTVYYRLPDFILFLCFIWYSLLTQLFFHKVKNEDTNFIFQLLLSKINLRSYVYTKCSGPGDPLLWLSQDEAVGCRPLASLRHLLSERGSGGCWTFPAAERHHRDKASL